MPWLLLGYLLAAQPSLADERVTVPAENRADRAEPPARPSSESAQEVGRRLFEAIVRDEPEHAAEIFFPRAAFSEVKAMARPERYHERLRKRFDADIHVLHAALGRAGRADAALASAAFVKLELGTRGGWVRPGEEGNRLPYWAARHAWLHYRLGRELRKLEVRVLISWGARWYVIHLREFR